MAKINTSTVSGRLVRDPIMRGNGSAAALTVASNRSYRKQNSEDWIEEVVYVDATAFSGLAKRCQKLSKGDFVVVTGRLELNRYEANDGTKREQLRLIAQEIDSPRLYEKGSRRTEPEAEFWGTQDELPAENAA